MLIESHMKEKRKVWGSLCSIKDKIGGISMPFFCTVLRGILMLFLFYICQVLGALLGSRIVVLFAALSLFRCFFYYCGSDP
jgi:hypothetical protein